MEDKQIQSDLQVSDTQDFVPAKADTAKNNSSEFETKTAGQKEGQSLKADPLNGLILGKFKSVEDLSKAYSELQKHQGRTSDELGTLRKELTDFNSLKEISERMNSFREALIPVIKRDREQYNSPEYFQNETFKEIYTEALIAYGDNLDTDRMINLLETYVKERISAYSKQKSAENETLKILDTMSYSQNPKTSLEKPAKTLSEMSDDEFRESVRKLI